MTVMLYRPADEPNPEVWGRCVEHRVFDEVEAVAALDDGWVNHPDELLTSPQEVTEDGPAPTPPKRRGRPPKEG